MQVMISDMVLILLLQPFALDPEMEGQVAPVQRPPLILSGGPCVLPALALGINIQVRLQFSFLYFYKGHGQLFYQINKKGHKNITGTEFMLHLVIQVSTTNPGSAL